ncbi:hypothetical protein Pint_32726 [Pistacia integerrima]|uniref:Uncharacterized protein n=1 Tax=Pistacia integerrima TaxID=434235 RepID=A0ACC0XQ13_9ROSI|nr:hypothetical protein Pint_32726 [Pistacia integerrima]
MKKISSLFDGKLNILITLAGTSLEGMTAVVTGGTKGIGHAVVEELAELGASVHTCSRNESELNECIRKWEVKGLKVTGSVCDLSFRSEREKLIKQVSSLFSGKLNILSAYNLSQLAHPLLKAAGSASIILMSSVCGVVSVNVGSIYAVTKGAMNQLAKNLACEWAKDNIRINSVAPCYGVMRCDHQVLSIYKLSSLVRHAVVEELAELGASVHTCSRNESELNECIRKWEVKGLKVTGSVCDLSFRSEREKLIKQVSSLFSGKLNILINNVGTNMSKPTEQYKAEDFSLS